MLRNRKKIKTEKLSLVATQERQKAKDLKEEIAKSNINKEKQCSGVALKNVKKPTNI